MNLTVPFEFAGRVWFVHGNFSFPMVLTKLRQRRIDGDACQPGGKPRSFIEILDMGEGIQKTVLHCVFGVFAVSRDRSMPRKTFLTDGVCQSSTKGARLRVAATISTTTRSTLSVANRWGIAHTRQYSHRHDGFLSFKLAAAAGTRCRSLNLSSRSIHSPDVHGQFSASSRPSHALGDFPASQPHLQQVENDASVVRIEKLLQLRDLLRLHTPA